MTEIASLPDRRWFGANPDRAFRVRPALDWEATRWPQPVAAGLTVKAIVRRADMAVATFAVTDATSLDDHWDDELDALFDKIRAPAGKGGSR